MTFSIKETPHKKCQFAESLYAECHNLLIVVISVVMLSVVMLNVVALQKLPGYKHIKDLFLALSISGTQHKWDSA